MSIQRSGRRMTPERHTRLESIGFVWSAREALWNGYYQQLVEFHRLHSHTNVPRGPGLGYWVKNQRGTSQPAVESDHWNRLNDLGFWNN